MVRALLIDDEAMAAHFKSFIERDLRWEVELVNRVGDLRARLQACGRFRIAIVDLSFPHEAENGLDALVTVHAEDPDTRLVILTSGDASIADLMRAAWEALPIAGAISKTTPTERQIALLRQIEAAGSAPPDPALQPWLPRDRVTERRAENFGRLVKHAGHAKLWSALIEANHEPSYRELAAMTGLKMNTLKNYRAQLVEDLRVFAVDDTSIRDMQAFAQRCRPLLAPHLDRKLGAAG